MTRRLVVAAATALIFWTMSGSAVQAQSWADVMFNELSHNWGTVARGATVRYPFYLTNTLNEPITIVSLRPSCGCTSGASDKSVVGPGERATVEAQMNTINFVGHKATILFVSLVTASGRQAEVRLAVSSEIQSDIVLNPGTIDFGYVVKGQEVSRTITIDRVGANDWRAMKMSSSVKGIDAKLVERNRTTNGVSYELNITLRKDAPEGVIRNDLFVHQRPKQSCNSCTDDCSGCRSTHGFTQICKCGSTAIHQPDTSPKSLCSQGFSALYCYRCGGCRKRPGTDCCRNRAKDCACADSPVHAIQIISDR